MNDLMPLPAVNAIGESRVAVLEAFGRAPYELADHELKSYYRGPKQTPSGLRTRRQELVKMGCLKHYFDVPVEVRGRKRARTAKAFGLTLKGQRVLQALA